MEEETQAIFANLAAAISELTIAQASLIQAVNTLSQNDQNLLTNIQRLSARMNLHEAYQASEEMDQPRVGH